VHYTSFITLIYYDIGDAADCAYMEGSDRRWLSDRIRPLNVMYRMNGVFAVPVYQALYQKECWLQGGPHVCKGVLRGVR
jgi:hypothetical protein